MVPPVPELHPPADAERETHGRIFLSTEWRDLLMLNYEIDPALLHPFVPRGTELDSFEGTTYVSLVGLRFARTKLFGLISVPFHSDFDEVNLRIYVRRREGSETRRGVMFIREIVSPPAVTFVARMAYAENYGTLPLRHSIDFTDSGGSIEYSWELKRQMFRLHGQTEGSPSLAANGSLEQFISEHYWGYSRRRDGSSLEYHVLTSRGESGVRRTLHLKAKAPHSTDLPSAASSRGRRAQHLSPTVRPFVYCRSSHRLSLSSKVITRKIFPRALVLESANSMDKAGQVLGGALRRLHRPEAALAWLVSSWPKIVGKALAARTRPLRCEKGCLEIAADNKAWRKQLEDMKPNSAPASMKPGAGS